MTGERLFWNSFWARSIEAKKFAGELESERNDKFEKSTAFYD
jgi:hypothetical protein